MLFGLGKLSLFNLSMLNRLLSDEEKILFAFIPNVKNIDLEITSDQEWLDFIWSKNGFAFKTLSFIGEKDCEVIVLGKNTNIFI
ncbi:hypothetical protein [Pasteurella testudinis]|uniref:hypothetical protein n=1 Tax=Pasteurella testudinis TaxID=761 RepID=UPI004058AF63